MIVFTIVMFCGAKDSTLITNVVWAVNIFTLLGAAAVGIFYVDYNHYANFFQKGFSKIMNASGTAFFAFIGFDTAAWFI